MGIVQDVGAKENNTPFSCREQSYAGVKRFREETYRGSEDPLNTYSMYFFITPEYVIFILCLKRGVKHLKK